MNFKSIDILSEEQILEKYNDNLINGQNYIISDYWCCNCNTGTKCAWARYGGASVVGTCYETIYESRDICGHNYAKCCIRSKG